MSISDDRRLKLWNTLERIRRSLDFSDAQMAELLGMTLKSFLKHRESLKPPLITSYVVLSDSLPISFEALMSGDIDYSMLRTQYRGKLNVLPEKYAQGAFSKRRTSANLLNFLGTFYGWELKDELLRRFQIHERVFDFPDEKISIRFLEDACAELGKLGFDEAKLYSVGLFSPVTNARGPVARALCQSQTVKELYDKAFAEVITRFDENCSYKITRLTKDSATVEAPLREEVQSALGQTHFGNSHICALRAGTGASLPRYAGFEDAIATETKCIHRGDPVCVYEFKFQTSAKRAKRA